MLPVAAVAVDCTYMIVLLTVPLWGARVRVLPKPLLGDVEIAKLVGAANEILPVRLLPETVICCRLGLADAVPAQAEMAPVTWPELIVGRPVEAGFTVMVNLTGTPTQPMPGEIKLPKPSGPDPTGTVATTWLVAVFITETLFENMF